MTALRKDAFIGSFCPRTTAGLQNPAEWQASSRQSAARESKTITGFRTYLLIGEIGDVFPGKPDCGEHLTRLRENPL